MKADKIAFGTSEIAHRDTSGNKKFFSPATPVKHFSSSSFFIQRTPDDRPATTPPAATTTTTSPSVTTTTTTTPAPPKNLDQMGYDARQAAHLSQAAVIDMALARSAYTSYFPKLSTSTKSIAQANTFILHSSNQNFVNAYNKCYGTSQSSLTGIDGFTCDGSPPIINLRPSATFGIAFHEAVHKVSQSIAMGKFIAQADANFAFDLNEGLTSYYTNEILKAEGITNYIDGYSRQRAKASSLVNHSIGKNEMDEFYFRMNLTPVLKKLGIKISRTTAKDLATSLKALW